MKANDSHEMSFASGRLTTAEQIVDRMLEKLEMREDNKKVFSIWLTSRHLRKHILKVYKFMTKFVCCNSHH